MKKPTLMATALVSLALIAGCDLSAFKSSLVEAKLETEEKIENVKTEFDRVSKDLIETKEKIEDKYEKGKKVLEAIDEFNEA